jgi:hypothetical protein
MPPSSRTSQLLAGTIGAVMLMGAGLADVRAQQQQQPTMPSELSQGQIETFADAAIDVQRVQQDFDAQLQAAENAEEIEQLQQQAQQEARQVIEDKGLSVDEYTAILQAANQDPQLYAMIVETMEQRAQQPPS